MTTSVKVDPANHKVRVSVQTVNDTVVTTTDQYILEPGSAEQTYYAYSSRRITVEEVE